MKIRALLIGKKRTWIVVGVAAVSIGLVACSGGKGDDPTVAGGVASTGAAVTSGLTSGGDSPSSEVAVSTGGGANGESPSIGAPSGVVTSVGNVTPGAVSPGIPVESQIASVETSGGNGASAPVVVVAQVPQVEPAPPTFARSVAASAFLQPGANQQTGIWVNGVGQIEVTPDIAMLSIGVEARESTVQRARDEAAEGMQRAIDAVKAQGVAADDIVTTAFNIQPQTIFREVRDGDVRYSVPEIIGYIVSNRVTVTIRDLDRVGDVVDAAAGEAGDLIRINNIRFTVEDTSQYGEPLRRLAAADARAKAEIYADAMGVELGPLVFLSESGGSVPIVRQDDVAIERAFALSARAPTPIMAGDTTLTTNVQVVFSLLSG